MSSILLCEDGQTNVDELDLASIDDCHIYDNQVQSMNLACFVVTIVNHVVDTYKLVHIVKKAGKMNWTYIPHLSVAVSYFHTICHGAIFLYKYLTIEKTITMGVVALLGEGMAGSLWLVGMWLYMFCVMSVAVSDKIGSRGVEIITKASLLTRSFCATQVLLFTGARLLLLTDIVSTRTFSFLNMSVFTYLSFSGGTLMFIYTNRTETMLNALIRRIAGDPQTEEDAVAMANFSPGSGLNNILDPIITMKRKLRNAGYSISALAFLSLWFCLACFWTPLLFENTWFTVKFIQIVGILASSVAMMLTPTKPPKCNTNRHLFWRLPCHGLKDKIVLGILETTPPPSPKGPRRV